jgi:NhaP-type Na+/H+ or K+/H+ antiporter
MPHRISAILGLVAFAACLMVGAFDAGNGFGTTVWRALLGMGLGIVVGYIIGVMAERMLAEHVEQVKKKKSEIAQESSGDGR